MNTRDSEIINETNSNRIKKYYNLSQLEELTGMSIRSLKYRMLDVKQKYKDIPMLLSKRQRKWQIHYTIVHEFHPKYNLKEKTIYTSDWTSMATWNPKDNYDKEYHIELINQIKQRLPNKTIAYTIELDRRNIHHTHIISDAKTEELNVAVTDTFKTFIGNTKETQILVAPLYDKFRAIEYIKKAPQSSGII
jgi:hypothetical protein